jgi:hypothetical protein
MPGSNLIGFPIPVAGNIFGPWMFNAAGVCQSYTILADNAFVVARFRAARYSGGL